MSLHSLCDVFFITYDEPMKEAYWEELHALVPHAKRVDGVKGFDAALKRCEQLAETQRFFTIDGDNRVLPAFIDLNVDFSEFSGETVLSWSSRNSINHLAYGNGGIKNWPRGAVRRMRTHEAAEDLDGAIDFCFQLNYYLMPEVLSTTVIHSTPYQAFRAGFREGLKMSLERGRRLVPALDTSRADAFRRHVAPSNLDRLRIWCSVGADVENGDWAIYGARLGCMMSCDPSWDPRQVSDYDWFSRLWRETIIPCLESGGGALKSPVDLSEKPSLVLNETLGLSITRLDPSASAFFKSVYINPRRHGPMFR